MSACASNKMRDRVQKTNIIRLSSAQSLTLLLRRGPPVRTSNRVLVDNLSPNCNWRDLKDLVRYALQFSLNY
jgi:hypothetical protein